MTYHLRLKKASKHNIYYRQVLHTTPQQQLVVMALQKGDEVPWEVHSTSTQALMLHSGCLEVRLPEEAYTLFPGDTLIIPSDTAHYLLAREESKLATIYSPPVDPPNLLEEDQP
jgi:quercetin dioxygenase-like cupin family protein